MCNRTLSFLFISALVLISLLPCLSSADPLDTWHWRNPLPQGYALRGITFGDGIFVAVGDAGTVLTSPDGVTWSSRNSGTTAFLSEVAFGNGTFVAVGESGTIVTSPDGVTWTSRSSGTGDFLNGVTFGNGTFVAVGASFAFGGIPGYGTVVTSPDGVSWSPRSLGTGELLNGVAFGNGTFVAVGASFAFGGIPGYGTVVTSPDGVSWSPRSLGDDEFLNGVTFGSGIFVAVGDFGTIITSLDGVTWTSRSSGIRNRLSGVTFGNGTFVAVGGSFAFWGMPEYGTVVTSPDGVSWTNRSIGIGQFLNGVTFGSGTFVAVGNSGTILQSDPTRATPAVRVNNTSQQITLRLNEALSVTVSFDAGGMSGINADWWVVAYAPYGWSYYVHPGMWFYAPSPESFRPAAQGPLFSFSPIEVLNMTGLHAGTYVVYFGVDTNANGVVDFDQLILDSTTIDVVP